MQRKFEQIWLFIAGSFHISLQVTCNLFAGWTDGRTAPLSSQGAKVLLFQRFYDVTDVPRTDGPPFYRDTWTHLK